MSDARSQLKMALGGAYTLEQELGGGGVKRVFVAVDRSRRRRVVIKALPPDLWIGVDVARFQREIALLASLEHPRIVPVFGAGRAGDFLYYMMPLLGGDSLRGKLDREGARPLAEAVRLTREIADALAYAHRAGVVHRDVRPDNILLVQGQARLTDCGVAQALHAGAGHGPLTLTGIALGTPAYMAPEQVAGDPRTDHRADIYAIGALAYELLTGHPPFRGASPHAVLAAHVADAPVPVAARRPDVPGALAELVTRCLHVRASERPQTAEEVVAALDAVVPTDTGTAPKGWWERMKGLLGGFRR